MKSIMISIKPKYVAKILNGEKTIEIRKTIPKCDLPIDVYIYCTKGKETIAINPYCWSYVIVPNKDKNEYFNGKVVAKFTLNKVEEIACNCLGNGIGLDTYYMTEDLDFDKLEKASCLTNNELRMYLGIGKNIQSDIVGYAWHISNLVIFDRPKELSEFRCRKQFMPNGYMIDPLTKAPQSFMYIEELL